MREPRYLLIHKGFQILFSKYLIYSSNLCWVNIEKNNFYFLVLLQPDGEFKFSSWPFFFLCFPYLSKLFKICFGSSFEKLVIEYGINIVQFYYVDITCNRVGWIVDHMNVKVPRMDIFRLERAEIHQNHGDVMI